MKTLYSVLLSIVVAVGLILSLPLTVVAIAWQQAKANTDKIIIHFKNKITNDAEKIS